MNGDQVHMSLILLAALAVCPAPTLIGWDWDDEVAKAAITTATRTCRTRYKGCLVRMERVTEMDFRAICRRNS